MKKILCLLMSIVTIICSFSCVGITAYAYETESYYGDLNADCVFNAIDVAGIYYYLQGEVDIPDNELRNADMDLDGDVDYNDYIFANSLLNSSFAGVDLPLDKVVDAGFCSDNVMYLEYAETAKGYFYKVLLLFGEGDMTDCYLPYKANVSNVARVEISDSITSISSDAFSNMTSLTSIIIPTTVTVIEDNAFKNCPDLIDVYYHNYEDVGYGDWGSVLIGEGNSDLINANVILTDYRYTACMHIRIKTEETKAPTCSEAGQARYICVGCNDVYTRTLPTVDHEYISIVTPPTSTSNGYTTHTCKNCGYSFTDSETTACDNSVLIALLSQIENMRQTDYSSSSYSALISEYNEFAAMADSTSQGEIDNACTNLLTAIYDLQPYFDIIVNGESESRLRGESVTLTAQAPDGYTFIGWYDTVNNRYVSRNVEYTFVVTENLSLKAVYVKENSATLTFATYSGWIKSTVTKTVEEWSEIDSVDSLIPDAPYRYGYSNGRWIYDNSEVLAKLQTGEDVLLIPEYDKDDTSLPTPPEPNGNEPVLELYYKLDEENNVGSFVMAAGIPDKCQIESIGTAFYYKKASDFDPTKFVLTVNNKMLVSKFPTDEIDDVYITNMNDLSSRYNWSVRGYVTYYDEGGQLRTVYSNQINLVDRQQI